MTEENRKWKKVVLLIFGHLIIPLLLFSFSLEVFHKALKNYKLTMSKDNSNWYKTCHVQIQIQIWCGPIWPLEQADYLFYKKPNRWIRPSQWQDVLVRLFTKQYFSDSLILLIISELQYYCLSSDKRLKIFVILPVIIILYLDFSLMPLSTIREFLVISNIVIFQFSFYTLVLRFFKLFFCIYLGIVLIKI